MCMYLYVQRYEHESNNYDSYQVTFIIQVKSFKKKTFFLCWLELAPAPIVRFLVETDLVEYGHHLSAFFLSSGELMKILK